MQAMGQDMGLRIAPRNELAVVPERAVAVVEGNDGVGECLVALVPRARDQQAVAGPGRVEGVTHGGDPLDVGRLVLARLGDLDLGGVATRGGHQRVCLLRSNRRHRRVDRDAHAQRGWPAVVRCLVGRGTAGLGGRGDIPVWPGCAVRVRTLPVPSSRIFTVPMLVMLLPRVTVPPPTTTIWLWPAPPSMVASSLAEVM